MPSLLPWFWYWFQNDTFLIPGVLKPIWTTWICCHYCTKLLFSILLLIEISLLSSHPLWLHPWMGHHQGCSQVIKTPHKDVCKRQIVLRDQVIINDGSKIELNSHWITVCGPKSLRILCKVHSLKWPAYKSQWPEVTFNQPMPLDCRVSFLQLVTKNATHSRKLPSKSREKRNSNCRSFRC